MGACLLKSSEAARSKFFGRAFHIGLYHSLLYQFHNRLLDLAAGFCSLHLVLVDKHPSVEQVALYPTGPVLLDVIVEALSAQSNSGIAYA